MKFLVISCHVSHDGVWRAVSACDCCRQGCRWYCYSSYNGIANANVCMNQFIRVGRKFLCAHTHKNKAITHKLQMNFQKAASLLGKPSLALAPELLVR
jgi:hypothetical protein